MPNLRHVADLIAGELHHIDVIRGRLFAGRLARTTGTGMSTRKDTVGSDVVALGISGKGLHLIAAVRHNRHLEDVRGYSTRRHDAAIPGALLCGRIPA